VNSGRVGWGQQSSQSAQPLTLCYFAAGARGASEFALREPHAAYQGSKLKSTIADSENQQKVEIKLAAPADTAFVETLFKKDIKVKPQTVDARRKKRGRGQNPIVVGSPDPEAAKTVDRRRRNKTTSTDALFTNQLLTAAQERQLGGLTVELLRLENIRDDLLRERGGRTPESLGYAGDNELEDQLVGVDCDGFRADWCERAELSSPEELTKRIRDGRAARQALVAANMRLVVSIAKRYSGLGMGLSDIVQEGSLGLMRAATKYDPARQCRFSTYACWWIQQAILRGVAFQSRLIRLPMHVHQDLAKASRAQREFQSDNGREPTDDELAEILNMKVAKLRRVRTAAQQSDAVSMETPRGFSSKIGGGETKFNARNGGRRNSKAGQIQGAAPVSAAARATGRTLKLEDTLESAEAGADRAVEMSLLHGAITEAFKDLDEDEQRVITLRYGLGDGVACSPLQVAERCEQSKDWVRRCEMRALRKLRKPHHLMMLQPYNSQRQSLLTIPS